jgi:hypothetical protein
MTALGWIIIIGTMIVTILGNSIASSLLGICGILVGLACIIAGVGYNIQVEIRRKNQQPETPPLKVSQTVDTLTNPDDRRLHEIPTPRSRSAYDQETIHSKKL